MLDIWIIIIVGIFGVVGYKRGFIKSALTLGSSIIALVLSFIVYPIIEMILRLTPVYTLVYQLVNSKLKDITFRAGVQSQGDVITNSITWIPSILVEQVKKNNNTAMYDLLGANNIKEYICLYITQMLIGLLALFLTWLILKFVLIIVIRVIVGVVENIPFVSGFNRQVGFVIGVLKGGIILSIIGVIIPIFIKVPVIQYLYSAIQTSYVTKWLYENNLIIIIYSYLFL